MDIIKDSRKERSICYAKKFWYKDNNIDPMDLYSRRRRYNNDSFESSSRKTFDDVKLSQNKKMITHRSLMENRKVVSPMKVSKMLITKEAEEYAVDDEMESLHDDCLDQYDQDSGVCTDDETLMDEYDSDFDKGQMIGMKDAWVSRFTNSVPLWCDRVKGKSLGFRRGYDEGIFNSLSFSAGSRSDVHYEEEWKEAYRWYMNELQNTPEAQARLYMRTRFHQITERMDAIQAEWDDEVMNAILAHTTPASVVAITTKWKSIIDTEWKAAVEADVEEDCECDDITCICTGAFTVNC